MLSKGEKLDTMKKSKLTVRQSGDIYKPKFRYTDKSVKLLTQISAGREIILSSPLIPKWEITLRKEAIIRSAHSSTRIEGNKLSLEQVSNLAKGRKVMAMRKDKQEVLNYLKVLENIGNLVKENAILEKDILSIHSMLTKDALDDPKDCGVFRNKYVVVGNKFTGEIFLDRLKTKKSRG